MQVATQPRRSILFVAALVVAAVLRIHASLQVPLETTDAVRNLAYGRALFEHGLAVYSMHPRDLFPDSAPVARANTHRVVLKKPAAGSVARPPLAQLWPGRTYNYPLGALLFFSLVAGVGGGLVVLKCALTLLDAVNAALIGRLSAARWVGLAYFASPLGQWYASREGQFEPVVNLFSLLSLMAGRRHRFFAAGLILAVAIQVKVLPLLLIPVLLVQAYATPWSLVRFTAGLGVGLLPSLLLPEAGQVLFQAVDPTFWPRGHNPFHWGPGAGRVFRPWMPTWLLIWNGVLTYGLLLVALIWSTHALVRKRVCNAVMAAPLIALLVVLKSSRWTNSWYVFQLVPLAAALPGWIGHLGVLLPCIEGQSTFGVVTGQPVGPPVAMNAEPWLWRAP